MLDVVTVAIGALPGLFGVLGLLMVGSGLRQEVQLRTFLRHAQQAEGRIVAVVQEKRKRTARYFVEIEFEPAEGETVRFRPVLSTDQPAFTEGEMVPVVYDPAKPERARVNEFWHLRFWPIFLLIVGGITATVGIWVLVSYTLAIA